MRFIEDPSLKELLDDLENEFLRLQLPNRTKADHPAFKRLAESHLAHRGSSRQGNGLWNLSITQDNIEEHARLATESFICMHGEELLGKTLRQIDNNNVMNLFYTYFMTLLRLPRAAKRNELLQEFMQPAKRRRAYSTSKPGKTEWGLVEKLPEEEAEPEDESRFLLTAEDVQDSVASLYGGSEEDAEEGDLDVESQDKFELAAEDLETPLNRLEKCMAGMQMEDGQRYGIDDLTSGDGNKAAKSVSFPCELGCDEVFKDIWDRKEHHNKHFE